VHLSDSLNLPAGQMNVLKAAGWRHCPHPYITALENRMDCWPALLLEIDDFIQQAVERTKASYITMLAPFLRYLYCEPQQQPQHALLRQSLLRVLLPAHLAARDRDQEKASVVHDSLLLCLCQLVPHMQFIACMWKIAAAGSRTRLLDFPFPPQPGPGPSLPLCSWFSEVRVAVSVLHRVAGDPAAAADWLWAVSSALSCSQQLPSSFVLIVTHLVIGACHSLKQWSEAADRLQVPSLIPVLMFKLTREKNPAMALAVLQCLPNLGTHKLCVPMVLQTLQMLASAPKLRAVVMRLMTALWKKQDRVYPELQRLLSQQDSRVAVGKDAEWERVLARAACLRDVCRERPYQHGADMLAGISLTLKQCNKADMATPAALALQGLRALCQAEVVDFISTWKHLGAELRCDSRPLMVEAVAELLSLVPQLAVKSDDYEVLS
uniref:DUF3730 domain-containing protein n=1 Tax=Oryzias latipes TaxID=8090 RepID=H2M9K6_ORYLA